MSTLKVTNIQNTSGGANSTADQIQQGRAKAWIRFNQSNNSIQSSFNVSSITDVATAKTDINFSTSFDAGNSLQDSTDAGVVVFG